MTIDKMLRDHCQIHPRSFFLAVLTDQGQVEYYSGPQDLTTSEIQRIFKYDRFMAAQQRRMPGAGPYRDEMGFQYDDYRDQFGPMGYPSGRRGNDRRRSQAVDFDDDSPPSYKTRKRMRATNSFKREMDDEPAVTVSARRGIKIGDAQEVWQFYEQCFKGLQQTACKLIAKAWVKLVAPKKQSTHPYTGNVIPEWWPGPELKVRHKEPDHLLKRERIALLCHILRLVVEPNPKQHPKIRDQGLTIAKLLEVAEDTLASFFSDKDNASNLKRKPFLKELFKVAKVEEQFKRDEIDATTEVYVLADDKLPEGYNSDIEEGDCKDEEDENEFSNRHPKTAMPMAAGGDQGPTTNLQPHPPYLDMPVRGAAQYAGTMDMAQGGMGAEQHSYVDNTNMGQTAALQTAHGMHDMMGGSHDSSRRASTFNSPAEYSATPGTAGLYATGPWGQQATTAPGNTAMYAFTNNPQLPLPSPAQSQPHTPGTATFVTQQQHQQSQQQQQHQQAQHAQQYNTGTLPVYDGLPGALNPGGATNMFRSQQHHSPQHAHSSGAGGLISPHSQTYPTYLTGATTHHDTGVSAAAAVARTLPGVGVGVSLGGLATAGGPAGLKMEPNATSPLNNHRGPLH